MIKIKREGKKKKKSRFHIPKAEFKVGNPYIRLEAKNSSVIYPGSLSPLELNLVFLM